MGTRPIVTGPTFGDELALAARLTRGHAAAEQLARRCAARPEQEVRMRSECLRAFCFAQARMAYVCGCA